MGKLADFKQTLKPVGTETLMKTENIPVKLLEFIDNDTGIQGIRLDTKEEVKVYLRDIDSKDQAPAQGAKKRPEFADFVKGKNKVEPGKAVFVIESSYKDKNDPNVYHGRWIKLVSKDPEETKVSIVMASLLFFQKENNETIFSKTVFPQLTKVVHDESELRAALVANLVPKAPGSNPFSVIKLIDNTTSEVETVEVYSVKVDREDDIPGKKTGDAELSYENFINKSPHSKLVLEFMNDPEITIEVLPGAIIYPGNMTKEQIVKSHPNSKKILKSSYYVKKAQPTEEEAGEDSGVPEIGYIKCVLATRSHADGTPYFTFIKPILNYANATSIKDIKKEVK